MHTNPYYGLPGLPFRAATEPSPHPAPGSRVELEPDRELDASARLLEWTGGALGRHGRTLLGEIETYLAFFEIARRPSAA